MDALKRLQRKFDLEAVSQLREEIVRLSHQVEELQEENRRLEIRASNAEQWADDWRDDFLELASQQPESNPGITKDGHLVLIHQ